MMLIARAIEAIQETGFEVASEADVGVADRQGVTVPDGQASLQPTVCPAFCSCSQFINGAKYSMRGNAVMSRVPAICCRASGHGSDEPSFIMFLKKVGKCIVLTPQQLVLSLNYQ
jgi:hypothetical protein